MGIIRRISALFLVTWVLWPSSTTFAQTGQTAAEEGPKVQQIRSVERGAFVEADFGLTFIVNKLDDRKFGLAPVIGLFGGYDILPILNIGLGVTAIAASISVDETTPLPVGDILFVIPSARVQFAVLTTERNFVWIRADVGLGLGLPGKIDGVDYGGTGLAAAAAVGFERFTKLRHFSVGGVFGAHLVTKPSVGIGISIVPMVKYTF